METDKSVEERVLTFLRVKTCDTIDKKYYSISEDRQNFILFDPIIKSNSDKSIKFEIDKIFTPENENSYIFEEITRDCLASSLNGEHYTYLSYGESASEKQEMLFGGRDCYNNLNTRGIFPRILEKLLTTISTNPVHSNNLTVNLSYIMVNSNKLFDLTKFIDKNLSSITQQEFITYGIDIKAHSEVLSKVKKLQVDNSNEVTFFLCKIFDMLYKLEVDSLHLLNWSHFDFIIYINDNSGKLISTLSFIILSGSEQLCTKVTNPHMAPKNSISNTKNVIETQFTFDDVKKNINKNFVPNELEESKFMNVVSKVSFNNKVSRKYRVIGSIVPNTGVYNNVKDTLMFLFDCKKTVRMRPVIKEDTDLKTSEMRKDDIIYDLEKKLKNSQNTIKELNERVDYKEKKIQMITENYKKQVEVLKNSFNFSGDVNVLISGNEYTKEAKFVRGIRNAVENCRVKSSRIEELEEKVAQLKAELMKNKALNEVKDTDTTMATIFHQVKTDKEREQKDLRRYNEFYLKIEELTKKNKSLEEMCEKYKADIEHKTKMLNNLPNILKDNQDQFGKMHKVKEDMKKKMKEFYKKEIAEIGSNNKKENKLLVEKYEKLIEQKDEEYKKLKKLYSELKENFDTNIHQHLEEMIRLYDSIEQMIEEYKKYFDNRKLGTNPSSVNHFLSFLNRKKEYDVKVQTIEQSVNQIQYPILFKVLNAKGIQRPKTKIFAVKIKDNVDEMKTEKIEPKMKASTYSIEEVERKSQIFEGVKTDKEVDGMKPEELINYIHEIHKKIRDIEEYGEKYIMYNKGYTVKEFEYNEKYIKDLHEKNKKILHQLEEQVKINNKNKVQMNSSERVVQQLNSEIFMLKRALDAKQINRKVSFPMFTNNSCGKIKISSISQNEGTVSDIKRSTLTKGFYTPGLFSKRENIGNHFTVQSTSDNTKNKPTTTSNIYTHTK